MDWERVLKFFEALHHNRVQYVLVGAVGMTVQGVVRASRDVDIFVRPEADNVARLRAALQQVFPEDANLEQITAKDLAGDYPAIMYNSPDGSLSVDILSRLGEAFSYEDIRFEEKSYEGIPVRVATPQMLYDMKKGTLRLQDRADAEVLKQEFGLED
jgi:acylphosphatase